MGLSLQSTAGKKAFCQNSFFFGVENLRVPEQEVKPPRVTSASSLPQQAQTRRIKKLIL